MGDDRPDAAAEQEHDPYARRPGYVTDVNGRTDRTTTFAAIGVAAGLVASAEFFPIEGNGTLVVRRRTSAGR
ncbi:hypothetical protein P9139_19685 [Curtobacterium flaccumfaciens]|nr:hypothetical protein P9139_19685 [Curtobacterium flaccumfaciens]